MTVEHITAMLHTWLPGLTMKMMIMMMMLNNFFMFFFFYFFLFVQPYKNLGGGKQRKREKQTKEAQLFLFFKNIYFVLILKFEKRRQD